MWHHCHRLEENPKFRLFQEAGVAFSYIVFSTFGIAGNIVVILDGLSMPRFTHGLVVRGASLSLPSRDYQLVHRSLFLFLCSPFFVFLVPGLPAGLVTVSSALGQLVRQMLPGHLTSASWHVAIPQGRTEDSSIDFHLLS